MPKSYEDKLRESSTGGVTSVDASENSSTDASASNPVESNLSGDNDSKSSKYTVIISDIDILYVQVIQWKRKCH